MARFGSKRARNIELWSRLKACHNLFLSNGASVRMEGRFLCVGPQTSRYAMALRQGRHHSGGSIERLALSNAGLWSGIAHPTGYEVGRKYRALKNGVHQRQEIGA